MSVAWMRTPWETPAPGTNFGQATTQNCIYEELNTDRVDDGVEATCITTRLPDAAVVDPEIYEFLESDLCLPSFSPTMTAM